jgi:hypothetical protein
MSDMDWEHSVGATSISGGRRMVIARLATRALKVLQHRSRQSF